MNKLFAAALLVALLPFGATAGDKPDPRFQIIRVGETVILLDSDSGQTWQLRQAAGGKESVWVPIRKAEDAAVKEVPLVQELDIQGYPASFAPDGLSKQEASDWYKKSASQSPRTTVLRSLTEASKFLDERVLARVARQFDPRRQQLVLFTWVSWSSSEKMTHRARDGKVDFVYEAGSSRGGPRCGEDCPNRYSRLFVVRQGVEWQVLHGGTTDSKEEGAGEKSSPKRP
jgi:hypothetical protein